MIELKPKRRRSPDRCYSTSLRTTMCLLAIHLVTASTLAGADTRFVVVKLSMPTTNRVAVSLATSPISATADIDFYGTYQVIEFAPGEIAKEVEITIIDDRLSESTETIKTRLFAPVGAALEKASSTIRIVDDD